jgi:uncharacterized membrane protein
MSNQTLRELAKVYAKGEIDKENYRKSRVELITAITEGKVNVKAIDFPPPLMPSEEEAAITETAKRDKTEVASPQPKQRPTPNGPSSEQPSPAKTNKKLPLMFISVSAVIVISLIIVVILFYPKPPGSATTETSNEAQATSAAATVSANMAGESLIADFLKQKNWSEASLETFMNSWSTLSQEERDSAKPSKRMQRMHDSIYKQFLEEKALSSIDSEKATLKQQKLIEFANAIGIDDSRLILE